MAKNEIRSDVLIIGGGLSGLTLAGVLGRAGAEVVVADRDLPAMQATEDYDARATALSWATHRVLEAAGAWKEIEKHAEPMLDIRVADGASPLFLHFDSETDAAGAPFGWNIENARLRRILHDNIRGMKTVRHFAPARVEQLFHDGARAGAVLENGARITAPLVVGADGRGSAVREWLGIPVDTRAYGQSAIVCTIAHDLDHENVATEHFLPEGPFALIPLARDKGGAYRSSVIWSVPLEWADGILGLPARDFDARLQALCGPHLGGVRCVSRPAAFPLTLQRARRCTGPRAALVADAAHVIHPIAGQGLNLGMRSVAQLAELVADRLRLGLDPGAAQVLDAYESARRFDARLMAGFTDALNRLFSNDLKTAGITRGAGLGIVQKSPLLKKFFARQAMGLGGAPSRIVKSGRV